ncbi:hypothetical protein [Crenothrix sp.]|uniref:hypothetical protein n=1 Tax=Crenothrix sp. TaxID=3100433 RepID=UPI00374CCB26
MTTHIIKAIPVLVVSATLTAAWTWNDTGLWVQFVNQKKGFACKCSNVNGTLTWDGKTGSAKCSKVSSVAPGIPNVVSGKTFESRSCCTTSPTVNGAGITLPTNC